MKIGYKERNKRSWLNPADHTDTGSLQTSIEVSKNGREFSTTFTVRDCSRTVTLDFSIWEWTKPAKRLAAIRKRRKKIQLFREHLDLMEEALEEFAKMTPEPRKKEGEDDD